MSEACTVLVYGAEPLSSFQLQCTERNVSFCNGTNNIGFGNCFYIQCAGRVHSQLPTYTKNVFVHFLIACRNISEIVLSKFQCKSSSASSSEQSTPNSSKASSPSLQGSSRVKERPSTISLIGRRTKPMGEKMPSTQFTYPST